MNDTSLMVLAGLGQSIWLDYIRSDLIADGTLRQMIEKDGLCGLTSNPAIFEKSIADSTIYDQQIHALALRETAVVSIYETISGRDVQNAANEFMSIYEKTDGKDGYVSLEVNPHLAHDVQGTIAEARRLWESLARPNVLIKVPATSEGLAAIETLISEGINVNVTLIFGLPRYRQVVEAYTCGLERRVASGKPIARIASVASFFLSRIDALVDPLLEKLFVPEGTMAKIAQEAHGQVAISSAKVAYSIYKKAFYTDRFKRLTDLGARPQRLLWASTRTKNPDYSDTKYVDPIIGIDTVSTLPLETLHAYRDHGDPQLRLEQGIDRAHWVLAQLPGLAIDIDALTQQLEDRGVRKFNEPFDKLMASIKKKSVAEAV